MSKVTIREWPGSPRSAPQPEEVKKIAESIKRRGLLQSPGVRRHDDGRLELLWGHRRFLACQSLGWTHIPAKVGTGLTDAEAESAVVAENLFRTELSYVEQACWTQRWLELNGQGDGPADDQDDRPLESGKGPAQVPISTGPPASTSKSKAAPKKNRRTKQDQKVRSGHRKAVESLASHTGKDSKAIYKMEKTARAFTDEQKGTLKRFKVNRTVFEHLANLDLARRNEALALIEGGIAPSDALARAQAVQPTADPITPDEAPEDHSGTGLCVFDEDDQETVDRAEAEEVVEHDRDHDHQAESGAEQAALAAGINEEVIETVSPRELSDEEWLDLECGTADDPTNIRGRLAACARVQFDREAVVYRRHADRLRALVEGLHADESLVNRIGSGGMVTEMLASISLPRHPKDWPVCDLCHGEGQVKYSWRDGSDHECLVCAGMGARVINELQCIPEPTYATEEEFEMETAR